MLYNLRGLSGAEKRILGIVQTRSYRNGKGKGLNKCTGKEKFV